MYFNVFLTRHPNLTLDLKAKNLKKAIFVCIDRHVGYHHFNVVFGEKSDTDVKLILILSKVYLIATAVAKIHIRTVAVSPCRVGPTDYVSPTKKKPRMRPPLPLPLGCEERTEGFSFCCPFLLCAYCFLRVGFLLVGGFNFLFLAVVG